jgi:tRNA pseudouridine synthase 10
MSLALDKYGLCKNCLKRQGDRSNFKLVRNGKCFICKGLTSKIKIISQRILRKIKDYEFSTFSVGIILPSIVQEKEDRLRSEFKIRGRETIKSQLSSEISKIIMELTGEKVDKLRPDLIILTNLKKAVIQLVAKPLFLYGRYTKPRGISQRKISCRNCKGAGCFHCKNSGFEQGLSIESIVIKKLGKLMDSRKMKFTWIGSEDAESEVASPGRPFIVEVKNPRRRKPPRHFDFLTENGHIKVSNIKILAGRPVKLPSFVFETTATIKATQQIRKEDLQILTKRMRNALVQFQTSKGKTVYKKVHSIRAKAIGKRIIANIKMDGGLPVKGLVSGQYVSPSISEVLKTSLDCQRFDILKIWEIGGFEFVKV